MFFLNLLTSAFIKADLRRQKANKETPENVSMWKLAGLKAGSQALFEAVAAWGGPRGSHSGGLSLWRP